MDLQQTNPLASFMGDLLNQMPATTSLCIVVDNAHSPAEPQSDLHPRPPLSASPKRQPKSRLTRIQRRGRKRMPPRLPVSANDESSSSRWDTACVSNSPNKKVDGPIRKPPMRKQSKSLEDFEEDKQNAIAFLKAPRRQRSRSLERNVRPPRRDGAASPPKRQVSRPLEETIERSLRIINQDGTEESDFEDLFSECDSMASSLPRQWSIPLSGAA